MSELSNVEPCHIDMEFLNPGIWLHNFATDLLRDLDKRLEPSSVIKLMKGYLNLPTPKIPLYYIPKYQINFVIPNTKKLLKYTNLATLCEEGCPDSVKLPKVIRKHAKYIMKNLTDDKFREGNIFQKLKITARGLYEDVNMSSIRIDQLMAEQRLLVYENQHNGMIERNEDAAIVESIELEIQDNGVTQENHIPENNHFNNNSMNLSATHGKSPNTIKTIIKRNTQPLDKIGDGVGLAEIHPAQNEERDISQECLSEIYTKCKTFQEFTKQTNIKELVAKRIQKLNLNINFNNQLVMKQLEEITMQNTWKFIQENSKNERIANVLPSSAIRKNAAAVRHQFIIDKIKSCNLTRSDTNQTANLMTTYAKEDTPIVPVAYVKEFRILFPNDYLFVKYTNVIRLLKQDLGLNIQAVTKHISKWYNYFLTDPKTHNKKYSRLKINAKYLFELQYEIARHDNSEMLEEEIYSHFDLSSYIQPALPEGVPSGSNEQPEKKYKPQVPLHAQSNKSSRSMNNIEKVGPTVANEFPRCTELLKPVNDLELDNNLSENTSNKSPSTDLPNSKSIQLDPADIVLHVTEIPNSNITECLRPRIEHAEGAEEFAMNFTETQPFTSTPLDPPSTGTDCIQRADFHNAILIHVPETPMDVEPLPGKIIEVQPTHNSDTLKTVESMQTQIIESAVMDVLEEQTVNVPESPENTPNNSPVNDLEVENNLSENSPNKSPSTDLPNSKSIQLDPADLVLHVTEIPNSHITECLRPRIENSEGAEESAMNFTETQPFTSTPLNPPSTGNDCIQRADFLNEILIHVPEISMDVEPLPGKITKTTTKEVQPTHNSDTLKTVDSMQAQIIASAVMDVLEEQVNVPESPENTPNNLPVNDLEVENNLSENSPNKSPIADLPNCISTQLDPADLVLHVTEIPNSNIAEFLRPRIENSEGTEESPLNFTETQPFASTPLEPSGTGINCKQREDLLNEMPVHVPETPMDVEPLPEQIPTTIIEEQPACSVGTSTAVESIQAQIIESPVMDVVEEQTVNRPVTPVDVEALKERTSSIDVIKMQPTNPPKTSTDVMVPQEQTANSPIVDNLDVQQIHKSPMAGELQPAITVLEEENFPKVEISQSDQIDANILTKLPGEVSVPMPVDEQLIPMISIPEYHAPHTNEEHIEESNTKEITLFESAESPSEDIQEILRSNQFHESPTKSFKTNLEHLLDDYLQEIKLKGNIKSLSTSVIREKLTSKIVDVIDSWSLTQKLAEIETQSTDVLAVKDSNECSDLDATQIYEELNEIQSEDHSLATPTAMSDNAAVDLPKSDNATEPAGMASSDNVDLDSTQINEGFYQFVKSEPQSQYSPYSDCVEIIPNVPEVITIEDSMTVSQLFALDDDQPWDASNKQHVPGSYDLLEALRLTDSEKFMNNSDSTDKGLLDRIDEVLLENPTNQIARNSNNSQHSQNIELSYDDLIQKQNFVTKRRRGDRRTRQIETKDQADELNSSINSVVLRNTSKVPPIHHAHMTTASQLLNSQISLFLDSQLSLSNQIPANDRVNIAIAACTGNKKSPVKRKLIDAPAEQPPKAKKSKVIDHNIMIKSLHTFKIINIKYLNKYYVKNRNKYIYSQNLFANDDLLSGTLYAKHDRFTIKNQHLYKILNLKRCDENALKALFNLYDAYEFKAYANYTDCDITLLILHLFFRTVPTTSQNTVIVNVHSKDVENLYDRADYLKLKYDLNGYDQSKLKKLYNDVLD